MSAELEEIELDDANQVSHAVECARSVVLRAVAVLRSLSLGAKVFIAKRKGNIHVDVRARGRAKRSAPRKAAGYTRVAPKSTKLLRHPNRQWHADTRAHRHSGTQTLAHDGTHGTVARRHSHTTAPTAQWHVDTRTQRHLRHSGT